MKNKKAAFGIAAVAVIGLLVWTMTVQSAVSRLNQQIADSWDTIESFNKEHGNISAQLKVDSKNSSEKLQFALKDLEAKLIEENERLALATKKYNDYVRIGPQALIIQLLGFKERPDDPSSARSARLPVY